MKKLLLFGFAGAMALASCTSEDVLKVADQQEMSFSAFVDKATKGAETNLNQSGKQFEVWGYKSKTGLLNAPVFSSQGSEAFAATDGGQAVVYGTAWTYAPVRYWDKTCSYDFFAVYPAGLGALPKAETKGTYVISNFVQDAVIADQKDLMAANQVAIDATTLIPASIDFTFKHLLTKVAIKFKSTSKQIVTLKSAQLLAVPVKGTAEVAVTNNTVSADWTIVSGTTADINPTTTLPVSWNANDNTTIIPIFENMLMIPQNLANFILAVNYTVDNEEFTRNIDLAGTAWNQNNYIIYTLSINNGSGNTEDGETPISFGTTTIDGWDQATSPTDKPVQ